MLVRVVVPARGELGPPVDAHRVRAEEQLEQDGEPEDRHPVEEERDGRRGEVERAAPTVCGVRADGYADDDREDGGEAHEQEGPPKVQQYDVQHLALVLHVGGAPVAGQRVVHVDDVLLPDALVQVELLYEVVLEVLVELRVPRDHVEDGLPGHHVDEQEVQGHDAEDGDHDVDQPAAE